MHGKRWLQRTAWVLAVGSLAALGGCESLLELNDFEPAPAGGAGGGAGVGGVGGVGGVSGGGVGGTSGSGGSAGYAGECGEPKDCPSPVTPCRVAHCDLETGVGECGEQLADVGDKCSANGGRSCDQNGDCVTCILGDGPDPSVGETDDDCGGASCPACTAGKLCLNDSDCESGKCLLNGGMKRCAPADCEDNAASGTEGDVNCGGPCTALGKPLCETGKTCFVDNDCQSGHCVKGAVISADPTGKRGVCCAVPCTGPCRSCELGTGVCTLTRGGGPSDVEDPKGLCVGIGNFCTGEATCAFCSNARQDAPPSTSGDAGADAGSSQEDIFGNETDIDCGGTGCAPCKTDAICNQNSDCESCICARLSRTAENATCQPPRCNNGVQDGCESDIDCGGACGAICGDGQVCNSKADCASNSCVDGKCVGP